MRFKVKKQCQINPSRALQSSWTAKRYVYTVLIAINPPCSSPSIFEYLFGIVCMAVTVYFSSVLKC